jgi:hypothetical protein
VGINAHHAKEKKAGSKTKGMRRRWSLATVAGRAALRCDRGRGAYGPRDENLQQPELDEPLVNPRRKKEGRRRLSLTGGDEFTTAAVRTRGGALVELGSSAWSGVLRVQRGVQELERVLK